MFAIAVKSDQYLEYLLSDDSALSQITVVPERGGIITQWKIQGQDILYLDRERFANPELSIRGGIPILFPICGNLPQNTFTYQNQSYTLKQHGFARDLPWEVIEQATDTCAHLTLVLNSNEFTRKSYPFDFKLTFTYELQGKSLKIRQVYTNLSQETMPFSTGLHPYFLSTNKQALAFEIPSSAYQDQQTGDISQFKGNFDFNQPEIDVIFKNLTRQRASISDRQRELKISLNYADIYQYLVFWAVEGKDYVCLEPWSAPRNALNTGESLTYLDPQDSCETLVEMVVSET